MGYILVMIARRTTAHQQVELGLSPDAEDLVRAALESAGRGESIELTAQESEHYCETGELPARLEKHGERWAKRWLASRK